VNPRPVVVLLRCSRVRAHCPCGAAKSIGGVEKGPRCVWIPVKLASTFARHSLSLVQCRLLWLRAGPSSALSSVCNDCKVEQCDGWTALAPRGLDAEANRQELEQGRQPDSPSPGRPVTGWSAPSKSNRKDRAEQSRESREHSSTDAQTSALERTVTVASNQRARLPWVGVCLSGVCRLHRPGCRAEPSRVESCS
jgi:hypothetical protein